MLSGAFLICRKDLTLLGGRGGTLIQALLLGLLLIFIFSFSQSGAQVSPRAAAAIFWVSGLFCQVLVFTALYALEEDNGQRQALLLAPVPPQAVWLGKALAGLLLLLAAQLVFLPASVIFLNLEPQGPFLPWLGTLLLCDFGLAALGSLLGALAQSSGPGAGGQRAARESIFSILAFPLLLPLLLAAIACGAAWLEGTETGQWPGIILAFDAVFAGAGLLLFGFVYDAQE